MLQSHDQVYRYKNYRFILWDLYYLEGSMYAGVLPRHPGSHHCRKIQVHLAGLFAKRTACCYPGYRCLQRPSLLQHTQSSPRHLCSQGAGRSTSLHRGLMRPQALAQCPVLVFANKSDLPNCMTVERIHAGLDLAPLGQQGRRSAVVCHLICCLSLTSFECCFDIVSVLCDPEVGVSHGFMEGAMTRLTCAS